MCIILLFFTAPGFNIMQVEDATTIWIDLPFGPGESPADAFGPPPEDLEPVKPPEPPKQESMEAKPRDAVAEETPPEEPLLEPTKETVIEKSVVARARRTKPIRRRRRTKTDRKISDALASIDKSLADRGAPTGGSGYGYKYGTGTAPVRVSPTDPTYIKYQALVRAKIIRNWTVPKTFASSGTKASAQLIVMINMNGSVVSVRWAKRSGIEAFDESARRAVNTASPLPKPPERLAWETYNEGFLIAFDARVK